MNIHAAEMEQLGRKLWGDPSRQHSTRDDIRFGSHGSKSINRASGEWFDHESGEGGGYSDLYERVHGERPPDPSIAATYDYHGADGRLVFQVVRKLPKTFRQRRPDDAGGWVWNLQGVQRIPYRLPELLKSAAHAPVFIVEGEKDVDALRDRGLIATTNPGGAGKWSAGYNQHFRGRHVVILPDNDAVGEDHAEDVATKLRGIARSIGILRLPDLPEKGDVSDWLAAGGTAEQLELLAREAPEWESEPPAAEEPPPKAEPSPPRGQLRIINPVDLEFIPVREREWIVPDWLPARVTTADYGDGGTGKTLLAQQLQTACATGTPWCGLRVARCRSLGVYCEDDEDELHRRQVQMCGALGLRLTDLADMRWVSGAGDDNALVTFTPDGRMHETERFGAIAKAATAFGAKLVVLDTAADLFAGNENDRHQVRQFIGLLTRLALAIDGAVLLNAHPSRTGLSTGNLDGGSTAWSNSVRSRWSLARPQADGDDAQADTNERILTRRKANYASIGDTIKLRWVNGVLVPVTVQGGVFGGIARRAVEDVFLALLDRCEAQGQRVSDSSHAPNYAPKVFARRPDAEGFGRRDFDQAMARLFAARQITMAEYGRKSDARQRIVRAGAAEADET